MFHFYFKMISTESPWQRLSHRWTSKDNAERKYIVAFYILRRQLNLYLEQGQYHVFSCNIQFMPGILV